MAASDDPGPQVIGQTLAHYKILDSIGKGGMGEVYRAEDVRLGRQVALKILPPRMAESAELRTRFEREARALAALNHPGIVTIHSVEEAGAGWSPDGRSLYVREKESTSVHIHRVEPATGRRELWKTVRPTDPAGFEEVYAVQIAGDGVSYYYTIYRILSDLYLVRGLG
jgi:serine/threonine protein kinase